MSVETHKNPICTHCALADAVIAFREGTGAAGLVASQRANQPDDAYPYSDDQLVRFSLMSGLGIIAIDLMMEEDDPRIRIRMMEAWEASVTAQQIAYSLEGRR